MSLTVNIKSHGGDAVARVFRSIGQKFQEVFVQSSCEGVAMVSNGDVAIVAHSDEALSSQTHIPKYKVVNDDESLPPDQRTSPPMPLSAVLAAVAQAAQNGTEIKLRILRADGEA